MAILDHRHGVNQQRCDHPECRAAVARWQKRWRYDVAQGNHRLVDPEPVRLHMAALEGAGWSVRAIAESAGVSPTTVSKVRRGLNPTVSRKVAAKIMQVSPARLPDRAAPRGFISRVGTVRRIHALLRMGWTHTAMGAYLGEHTQWTVNRIHQGGRWVTRDVHNRVAAMYHDLSSTTGPSMRTASRAERRGYPGPADWDDIDHDAEPARSLVLRTVVGSNGVTKEWVDGEPETDEPDIDWVVIDRRLDGQPPTRQLTHDECVELVRRARDLGWSETQIVTRAGVHPERYGEEKSA